LRHKLSIRELCRVSSWSNYPELTWPINIGGAAFAKRGFSVDGIEKTFAYQSLRHVSAYELDPGPVRQASAGSHVKPNWRGFLGFLLGPDFYGTPSGEGPIVNFLDCPMYLSKLGNGAFYLRILQAVSTAQAYSQLVHPGPIATQFNRRTAGVPLFPVMAGYYAHQKIPRVGARHSYLSWLAAPDVAGITEAIW